MRLLVINVGSSSLRLSVLDGDELLGAVSVHTEGRDLDESAVKKVIADYGPIEAVGHRIVHGGTEFSGPVLVDEHIRHRLQALVDLAPLHLPKSLTGLDLTSRLLPDVPTIACFDTTFHNTIPAAASTYALPAEWRTRWPIRRFGFHGLSHAWASARTAQLVARPVETLRIVTCHLGSGASLAAVAGGISVDTTMGFTPLEGLVMASRSGSVDPGLVLWLEQHVGIPPAELASALEHRSGLVGLSGSADMRKVLDAEAQGDPDAILAIAVYLHRLRAGIAAMAAAMDGLDVLVFTGGIGEGAPSIRSRTATNLGFLGVEIDEETNATTDPDAEITRVGAQTRVFVIEAHEDVQIAREMIPLLVNSKLA